MVSDMQQALNRVPPEVASSILLQQTTDVTSYRKSNVELKDSKSRMTKSKEKNIMEPVSYVFITLYMFFLLIKK